MNHNSFKFNGIFLILVNKTQSHDVQMYFFKVLVMQSFQEADVCLFSLNNPSLNHPFVCPLPVFFLPIMSYLSCCPFFCGPSIVTLCLFMRFNDNNYEENLRGDHHVFFQLNVLPVTMPPCSHHVLNECW
jgi:hypothetical protein